MVMEVVHEDMSEGNTQCTNHPYKTNTLGGICAFCLQEKLGKLVSSSYPSAVFPSSSSSPSPSSRSAFNGGAAAPASAHGGPTSSSTASYCSRKSRLPFVLTHKKKKKKDEEMVVFKRSKSIATPRRVFLNEDYSPTRRFWKFLYSTKHSTAKGSDKNLIFNSSQVNKGETRSMANVGPDESAIDRKDHYSTKQNTSKGSNKNLIFTSPHVNNGEARPTANVESAIDKKISRSRSVGCGSRSFSGDLFERISTGLGDCTLRRVESQREGRLENGGMRERVKCGGIFRGFMVNSSYVITSGDGKCLGHGRSKSWGWALASPMRAFGKYSAVRREGSSLSKNDASVNLDGIPSLLAVSG